LAEVGVGCKDWPDCYAILNLDVEKRGITVLTERGEDMAYRGARLAHRYIASTLGLVILIVFILAARQGSRRRTSMAFPLALMAITLFLSLLGYYTPTRSNPLITVGNLLGGFSMLALLWWMRQRYAETQEALSRQQRSSYRPLVLLALTLVIVQVVLGAWSSANYASSSCPGLISCDSPWLQGSAFTEAYNPLRDIELDQTGRVVREPALGVLSMFHRIFALFTAGYLAWMVRKVKLEPTLLRPALALSACSIGLLLAGVSMIWWQMPLLVVTLHNTLAAGLLAAVTGLLQRLTPVRELPVSDPS
jgi:cytochrome c oxidase assembly protein subunit 15